MKIAFNAGGERAMTAGRCESTGQEGPDMTAAAKVVIVGSGIIGASSALACQDLGAEVTVVDRGPLGGLASANSFGWINASFAETQAYFDLRNAAVETFRSLGQRLDLQAHVCWPGTLWWEDAGQDFEAQFASLTARGYGARRIDHDEIAALEPNLRDCPPRALLTGKEGAAQAQFVAQSLLAHVARRGGRLCPEQAVTAVHARSGGGHIVQTSAGDLPCDFVILATGAAAYRGLNGVEWTLPMANKRGMIVQTEPVQTRIHHILMTPDVHFRQNPDGSLVAGEIFSGDLDHEEDAPALAEAVIARIGQKLRGQPEVQLAQVKLGQRPVPLDGLPVVGAVPDAPGIFVAVMHSGVTLGPLIGQLLAEEILQAKSSPLLSQFRATRYAGA